MINIGKTNKGNLEIDLKRLVSTRLLIQGNSGAGKSWAIRRLLEQSHGQIQQIVIDLEGEFSTLREKYDYLLVGKDGEIPAKIQTAELLARKLLEINVSTIIDLSELKHHERILFVKRFLDSLVNTPRKLWHPCLVILDEAHQFCPEKTKSESTMSVIDLQTRGRKRGFCGVLATQRIAKLNKDAAADCNNVIVGRTGLDIDRKRASNDLGFTTKEQERSLRKLEDGEFFAYGPAISRDIVRVKIGNVNTEHPEPGKTLIKASKTPDNIKKMLKDVIDLPKEAEEELKNLNDYKTKVMELKREVRTLEHSKDKPVIDEKQIQKVFEKGIAKGKQESEKEIKNIIHESSRLKRNVQKIKLLCDVDIDLKFPEREIKPLSKPIIPERKTQPLSNFPHTTKGLFEGDIKLGLAEKKIYSLLCQYPERAFNGPQIGTFTGYAHTSGSFGNSIGRLKSYGLIEGNKNSLRVKEIKQELMGQFDFSIESIIDKLGKCEKEIYNILLEKPHEEFTKESLAEATPSNYSGSSGSFGNAIGKLNTYGLIKKTNGLIQLNPDLLEL